MVSVKERDDYTNNKMTINFEETELRLGLGLGLGLSGPSTKNNNGKRGFIETTSSAEVINNVNNDATNVDLKLNLSSNNVIKENKLSNPKSSIVSSDISSTAATAAAAAKQPADHPVKPPAKAQVVGWPPVRSFRKNIVTVQKKTAEEQPESKATNHVATSGAFVKVSMDGAPYLRKVDLKLYKSYKDLSEALGKMFSSFTIGNCGSQGMKDFMNESKLIDLLNGSEYAATYEDKDGDWMLVGDVPWTMFVESCRRLRIMKGSEAIGLAPRAVEKCKSRS